MLIKEDNLLAVSWHLNWILYPFPGKDNLARVFLIETLNENIRRNIYECIKLSPINIIFLLFLFQNTVPKRAAMRWIIQTRYIHVFILVSFSVNAVPLVDTATPFVVS